MDDGVELAAYYACLHEPLSIKTTTALDSVVKNCFRLAEMPGHAAPKPCIAKDLIAPSNRPTDMVPRAYCAFYKTDVSAVAYAVHRPATGL